MTVDIKMMSLALDQAQMAAQGDEVPIGAIVVCRDQIIARTHNLTQTLIDPTAHAEMQAITASCNALGGKYLPQCTIYVTVEPCGMCAAALRWAQIGRVVYGASDPKFGYSTISTTLLHPRTKVEKGVLEHSCGELMRSFFAKKRCK